MTGFIPTPLAYIADLKGILRDQYDERSILKELLQNADDAEAREIHVGFHAGWPDAQHPLLRGSCLVVLNDGPFTSVHADAIRRPRVGTKGAQAESIGRFGLGMKSVFHLCEAFFFLASASQPAAAGEPYVQLLNPWHGTGFHTDWDLRSPEWERLYRSVDAWAHGCDPWFCLWIPLRSKQHLDGVHPITSSEPKAHQLVNGNSLSEIARFLPLLRSVKRVALWKSGEWGASPEATLQLEQGAVRSAYPRCRLEDPSFKPRFVQGAAQIQSAGNTTSALFYAGVEELRADLEFAALQDDSWPRCVSINHETAEVELTKEEVLPHAAAVWVRTPAPSGEGTLEIRHGVFLPLAECLETPASFPSRSSWMLLLHGCFFLDAARKTLVPANQWNRLLQARALHGAVLPALRRAVVESGVSDAEVEGLTGALAHSRWFADCREEVCRTEQWVLRVTSEGAAWRLIPSHEAVWSIPLPRTTGVTRWELPFAALPGLTAAAASRNVTFGEAPRLASRAPRSWTNDLAWLDQLPAETLTDSSRLDYFVQFVDQERTNLTVAGWTRLVSALAAALATADLDGIRKHAASFRRLISFLPPDRWCLFPASLTDLPDSDRVLHEFLTLGLGTLLVPETLTPGSRFGALPGEGTLTLADAVHMLDWLSPAPPAAPRLPQAARADLAFWILEHANAPEAEQRRSLGRYPVFRVYDLSERQNRLATWEELLAQKEKGRLFTAGGSHLGEPLQAAMPGTRMFRLREDNERTSQVLFGGSSLSALNREVCVALLAERPPLGPPEDRAALLSALTAPSEGGRGHHFRPAVRYLLHGSAGHYEDTAASLVSAGALGGTGVLIRAAEQLLSTGTARWRCVPQVLSDKLNIEQWRELGIVSVTPGVIGELIKTEAGPAALGDLPLSNAEREELLYELRYLPEWRSLPLHGCLSGELCELVGAAFFAGSVPVPPILASRVRVVDVPEHDGLRLHYERQLAAWSNRTVVEQALDVTERHPTSLSAPELCQVILHHFQVLAEMRALPDGLRKRLRGDKWLPTCWGPRSPADVLDLPGMEEEVARVLHREDLCGLFLEIGALPPEAQHVELLPLLRRELFPSSDEALLALGECLAETEAYSLGDLRGPWETGDIEDFILAFGEVDHTTLPAYPLLRAAFDSPPHPDAAGILLRQLLGAVSATQVVACLNILTQRHGSVTAAEKRAVLHIHLRYLECLAADPGALLEALGDFQLLNRKGHWKHPAVLCLEAGGIDDEDLLDREQAAVLRRCLGGVSDHALVFPADDGDAVSGTGQIATDTASVLESYFNSWLHQSDLAPECIGGFLCFIGGHPDVEQLAQRYLSSKRTVMAARNGVEWSLASETLGEAMRRHRVVLRVVETAPGDTFSVRNLVGEPFEARVSRQVEHLFLGEVRAHYQSTYRGVMRRIDPGSYSRQELQALLVRSIEHLVYRLFNQRPGDVGILMDGLAEGDQLDLQVTQHKILQNAFAYFRMLDGGRLAGLRDLVVQWDLLYYREQERLNGQRRGSEEEIRLQRDELQRRLREQLECDPATQTETLEAVAHRVRQCEYRPESILFEIFQNADDAAVELGLMSSGELPSAASRLVVSWSSRELAVLHWGRPVNVFRSPTFPEEEGVRRGFHDDLAKMLLLSASDKSTSSGAVTGKFGLGFKSVFLLTDLPRMLSGQLGFEVVGGLFPRKLDPAVREKMAHRLAEADPNARSGSLIELPVRVGASPVAVVEEFRSLVHVLLVFARRIKTCVFEDLSGKVETLTWREQQPFPAQPNVRIGALRAAAGPSGTSTGGALMLDGQDQGSVLLSLDSRGITHLPALIPTFWVTAPTRTRLGAGFAVNAPFALDVGRTQLALDNPDNLRLATSLGTEIGKALVGMFDAAADWSAARAHLRLADDVTPYEFWHSLWNLMGLQLANLVNATTPAEGGLVPEGDRLLHALFWTAGGGTARLFSERPTLPSCLWGEYRVLSRLECVRWAVAGVLEDETAFERVCLWPVFRAEVDPGSAVSGSRVWSPLSRLVTGLSPTRLLRLARVWEWEWRTSRAVTRDQAGRWGKLVTPEFLTRMERDEVTRVDVNELDPLRKQAQFRTVSGEYCVARDLLAPQRSVEGAEEERNRGAFAPDDRLLHPEYTDDALSFFEACRGPMSAGAELLAQWGRNASTSERQHAFLKYLINGQLAAETARHARDLANGTWLAGIQDAHALNRLSLSERAVVLGQLQRTETLFAGGPVLPPPLPPVDTHMALEQIYAWWTLARPSELDRYLSLTYPRDGEFLRNLKDPYEASRDERHAWLLLFLRGTLESTGRSRPGQHRNFLNLLEQRGLVQQALASAEEVGPILEGFWRYLDECVDEVRYYQSFKQYLPMVLTVRWLDDYVRSLLFGNSAERFNLRVLLRPRVNPAFGHDDPDAPPLAPLLQMGAHFVLRELVRLRVITHPDAVPDCYVPTAGVCRLIAAIGGPELRRDFDSRSDQSRAIHEILVQHLGPSRATFHHAFDIPLRLLAEDADLRSEVLEGYTLDLDGGDTDE